MEAIDLKLLEDLLVLMRKYGVMEINHERLSLVLDRQHIVAATLTDEQLMEKYVKQAEVLPDEPWMIPSESVIDAFSMTGKI